MQSRLGAPSEHQTSDASIGYPPGLTVERLISFARNNISRTFAKTLFTGGAKHYSLVLQLISFTKKTKPKYRKLRKHYSRARKNTIQKPERLYAKYVRLSLRFQIDQIYVFGFLPISHPYPSFYSLQKLSNIYQKCHWH